MSTVSVSIMGGLGNQMFQLAAAFAYAKKYNGNFKILRNKLVNDGRPIYWDSILSNFTPYLVDSLPSGLSTWQEISATQYSEIIPLEKNGIILNGYLQSSKYFNDNSTINDIKALFKPSDEYVKLISTKYKYLIDNKDRVVVVHARRTDYCMNSHMINVHGPLTIGYYRKAVTTICEYVKEPIFLLISDDNKYWHDMFKYIPELNKKNTHYLDNENDVNTIILMQQFYHFIIANSTFSWWGAWLANDPKKVIVPAKWFGPSGPNMYEDIYEEGWIRL